MKFGDRLKFLRKEKDFTQSELAKIFSLGESTISFYESNKRTPDYELLEKIADFFNVSVDYLLGRTDNKNIDTSSIDAEKESSNPFFKEYENLSEEGRKELEKYLELLKLKENMEKSKDETSSALENEA